MICKSETILIMLINGKEFEIEGLVFYLYSGKNILMTKNCFLIFFVKVLLFIINFNIILLTCQSNCFNIELNWNVNILFRKLKIKCAMT